MVSTKELFSPQKVKPMRFKLMMQGYDFRRAHERKDYAAEILFSHKERMYSGNMRNISLGGAFIETISVNQFSSGDIIILSIPDTKGKKHIKRRGRIKWLSQDGFAIEFV